MKAIYIVWILLTIALSTEVMGQQERAKANKLTAGTNHSLLIKSDGTLWAWGDNSHGAVGDGTSIQRNSPIQIGNENKWLTVSASFHSLAIKSDGTLWAWGYNFSGEVGDGTTTDKTSPLQVGTDNKWLKIAAGGGHSLAIKSDGTLWAWGDNSFGQIGDGTTTQRNSPIQIGTDDSWVNISGGNFHSLALKSNGTLWGWGRNDNGQLGDGTSTNQFSPVQIGSANTWVKIAGSISHSFALKSDGTLWAWGNNSFGQLGDGTNVSKTAPIQVGTDNNWMQISNGDGNHTLAIKSNGSLWGWGRNIEGQLGTSNTINSNIPQQIGTENNWIAAGGSNHSLALKSDGTVWAWGYNGFGQVGTGTQIQQNNPASVTSIGDKPKLLSSYAANGSHTLCIKANGTLWAWGRNNEGQLGDGSVISRNLPVKIGTANNWKYINAGSQQSYAIKSDGTLWAWGENTGGLLANGTNISTTIPIQVGFDNDWEMIVAGNEHVVALKSDGTLWVWGFSISGNMGGIGTTNVPLQLGTDNNWVGISTGYRSTIALKSNGTRWACGWNQNGELGNASTGTSQNSITQMDSDNDWVLIDANGASHTIGLKSNGTMWGWGGNGWGQIGAGNNTLYEISPVQSGSDNSWISLSSGSLETRGIKTDGTLWAWGRNGIGEFGNGTYNNNVNTPLLIGVDNDWTFISNGALFSIGIHNNGLVCASGNNTEGQLGNGTTEGTNTFNCDASVVLPLTFLSFTAQWSAENPLLTWKTENEINTLDFSVERSTDGIHFNAIDAVPARNVSGQQQYHYTDYDIAKEGGRDVYYRLNQRDKNGGHQFSKIILLKASGKGRQIIVYPNPALNDLNITVNALLNEDLHWQILDVTGRILLQGNKKITVGSNQYKVDLRKLAAGMYTLNVEGKTVNQFTRFIKK